jgi:glyoxylase-like metal-dependent hydrolase (beta-lactamase superfamily II)
MLVETLQGESFAANCYIVASETTRRGLVIDPGVKADRIAETIKEHQITPVYIVLTHAHIDHCSALGIVKETTGALFAGFASNPAQSSPAPRLFIPGLTFTPFQLPFSPDRLLQHGDTLIVDDICLTVLHTPGHSSDSICLAGHGALFSGDTLMRGQIGASLPGLLPGYDHRQLLESIHHIILNLPDDTIVYPGHGSATTIGKERLRVPPMLA